MTTLSIGHGDRERSHHTIIVGGGQAGLAAGYFLQHAGTDFVILDENPQTGASWRKRWDSLRLFSPSQFDGLPGLPYPGRHGYFPTKDELADYLQAYRSHFELPVRHGVKVERLERGENEFRLAAGPYRFTARNVIVATGPHQRPHVPAFASALPPSVEAMHSSSYCNPSQIRGSSVLVVGAGNSGAEIALELAAAGKRVWLAGRDVGVLPITTAPGRILGGRPAYWLMNRILTTNTPMGRKVRQQMLHRGHPLGRARRRDLAAAGVQLTGRVADIESGMPRLEDGRTLEVNTVIWATGFRPDFSWIDLPVFDELGYPVHHKGVIPGAPGLYFLGLPFQSAFNSALLGGVGRDAAYVTRHMLSERSAA